MNSEIRNILEDVCKFYERNLNTDQLKYLKTRYGLNSDFVHGMRIGYAPEFSNSTLSHLMAEGHTLSDIFESGLVSRYDNKVVEAFKGRLMFPYLDDDKKPLYFIGRATEQTPHMPDKLPPKYKKLKVTETGPTEPIFGSWSITDGKPLVITEGVTDCLIVLQEGYPSISPVTTRFKKERIEDVALECGRAGPVYLINDNEESEAGLQGAAKTATTLLQSGIKEVFICEIPRPEGIEKVDLNDFLRNGGNIQPLIDEATPGAEHPRVKQEYQNQRMAGITRLRSSLSKTRWQKSGREKNSSVIDAKKLKMCMPNVSQYAGIPPGCRGVHPVYGSSTGQNFAVSDDGETYTSFHGGAQKGRGGDIFKLVALEQGYLNDEDMPLRGEAFLKTIRYCKDNWG
ncbi:toprim domain-containing protein [Methanoplanus endosymbiosus]|uniref:Toprim domain-containing protein n=1 Tax=Methanoplanus endosymbiosus TaxID=33865 RepID=A0A9E7PRJ3_9EURY|nr:toprim domain-containing protein [Methanoplanus endosymbiosus]UUX93726.1 toprim domain-containing protein [Methanoplanus endosymbiosus]